MAAIRNPANDTAAKDQRYPDPVADLMPLVHARDAAQAKIAAIGSVNPRAGGLLNRAIQIVKKTISRALRWFVRDQIIFNRETVSALEAVMEALNDHNRVLVSLASQTNEHLAARVRELSAQIDARAAELSEVLATRVEQVELLQAETIELRDIRKHWIEWRADWEHKLATNEIQFLRSVADLQGGFQHRVTLIETGFRDMVKSQHADYVGALDRATLDIQQRLWRDLEKMRGDYERLIHLELRMIRQRALISTWELAGQLTGRGTASRGGLKRGACPRAATRIEVRLRPFRRAFPRLGRICRAQSRVL